MRCAIYTRKSTEEGLGQEFNSLDAQREAAEAYILSQRQAGWTLQPERYDDAGYTGANLERPALCRLLADIEAGRVECVVVYKIDRLSQSLLDFARLMSTFERHEVNFVSVTQQFNTTGSLGRLTTNVLLAFSQFERELVVERTQDKMAASRRKGKWVGGIPVLGYDVASGGGKLVVNEEEARQVRAIFDLYLEQQALLPVLRQLQHRQWNTKRWTTQGGTLHRGRPYSRRVLFRLLTNVVYLGKVDYRGQTYSGEHAAIVEERVWQRVQSMFQKERAAERRGLSIPQLDRRQTGPQPYANEGRTELSIAGAENPQNRMPRITRLLALAIKFEGLLQQGVVKDYSDLARLGQVSRARVTQIMNLLNLAPDIQEEILCWAGTQGKQDIRETTVRTLSAEVIWTQQREQWKNWTLRYKASAKD